MREDRSRITKKSGSRAKSKVKKVKRKGKKKKKKLGAKKTNALDNLPQNPTDRNLSAISHNAEEFSEFVAEKIYQKTLEKLN